MNAQQPPQRNNPFPDGAPRQQAGSPQPTSQPQAMQWDPQSGPSGQPVHNLPFPGTPAPGASYGLPQPGVRSQQGPVAYGPQSPLSQPSSPQPPYWDSEGYPDDYGDDQRSNRSRAAVIVPIVILLIAALLAALGTYFWLANRDNNSSAQEEVVTVTQTPSQTRPNGPASSRSSTSSSSSSKPTATTSTGVANLQGTFTVSGPTSPEFAQNVTDAFMEQYKKSKKADVTISVFSPITGRSYEMTCKDRTDHVHCSGGNDANVYIR